MDHLLKLPTIDVPELPEGCLSNSPKGSSLKLGDIAIFQNTVYAYSRLDKDAVRFVDLSDGRFFIVPFLDYMLWSKAASRWASTLPPKSEDSLSVEVTVEDDDDIALEQLEDDDEAEAAWDGNPDTMPRSLRHAGWAPGCPCCTSLADLVTAALKGAPANG